MQQRQSIELARRNKMRQSYRQKYYETDGQKPIGNYRLLMTDYHKAEPFLTIGPNYVFFVISFLLINLITVILLNRLNKNQDTKTFFLILTVVIIFLDVVWLATALINPGIATEGLQDDGEICEVCQANNGIDVVKQINNRFHCTECDVCIDEHETHLRLIGGCVGKNNFIVFKLLLLGMFVWVISMITFIPQTQYL